MESGRKNEGPVLRKGQKEVDRREGREEEGICRTNVKVLPTPLLCALESRCLKYSAVCACVRV